MSKWGYVSKSSAKAKFENQPEEAFDMVEEMARAIIDKDTEAQALNKTIQDLQTQMMFDRGATAELTRELGRLEGYRDRVREVDGMEEIEEQ